MTNAQCFANKALHFRNMGNVLGNKPATKGIFIRAAQLSKAEPPFTAGFFLKIKPIPARYRDMEGSGTVLMEKCLSAKWIQNDIETSQHPCRIWHFK